MSEQARPLRTHQLRREIWLPRPLAEVFEFFADAGNLETITPPWLHFEILTPRPVAMKPGTRIDYRLRLRGIPLGWSSEITVWDPPRSFVDEQRRGPYRLWIHRHLFETCERKGRPGTLVTDEVEYAVPGGEIVRRLVVAPDLERIFDHRRERLAHLLG